MHEQRQRLVNIDNWGAQIWFTDGPPAPTAAGAGQDSRRRFAIIDGSAWFIEQMPLHPIQQQRAVEAAVMPHSLLNAAVYTLSTHGWAIPHDIRPITLERETPLDTVVLAGDAALVRVDDQWLLGCQHRFDTYTSFTTVYMNEWLFALRPSSANPLALNLSA